MSWTWREWRCGCTLGNLLGCLDGFFHFVGDAAEVRARRYVHRVGYAIHHGAMPSLWMPRLGGVPTKWKGGPGHREGLPRAPHAFAASQTMKVFRRPLGYGFSVRSCSALSPDRRPIVQSCSIFHYHTMALRARRSPASAGRCC